VALKILVNIFGHFSVHGHCPLPFFAAALDSEPTYPRLQGVANERTINTIYGTCR